jgi:hypothetical protein
MCHCAQQKALFKVNKRRGIENMTTLGGINGARVGTELIRFPNGADSGSGAPCRMCVERENRRKFRAEKKLAKESLRWQICIRKGTFVYFARRSVVNLSDCQFTANAPLATFVMLIFPFSKILSVTPFCRGAALIRFENLACVPNSNGGTGLEIGPRVIRQVIR